MNKMLSFTQVLNLIKTVGDKRTVIVEGENGVGKSALYYALANDPKFENHIKAGAIDCTQMADGSVWMPDLDRENGVSRELPNERFGLSRNNQKGVNGSRPVLVFLDEIAKAPAYIKNVLAPIIYERRVGNYHMPEGSVVFCATNLAVEGLGDSIQAHLRNRLVFVKMRKPTAGEWVQWAIDKGVNASVIAFVNSYAQVMDSFLDYEKGGKHEGKQQDKDNGYIFNPRSMALAYATPRSLVAAGDVLDAGDGVLDDDTLEAALIGTLGATTAESLSSFVRFGRDICSLERVLKDPATAPLADNPTAQLVQVFQFVSRVDNREDAAKIVEYVLRMRTEMQSIFCNSVANSSNIAHYVSLTNFGSLLASHKIFFSTK
jgi:hypothetical protein